MSNSLAKRPASTMREYTQQVRDAISATDRLRDQYFSKLKRAEAEYFEGVKRIHEAMAQDVEGAAEAPAEEQPQVQ